MTDVAPGTCRYPNCPMDAAGVAFCRAHLRFLPVALVAQLATKHDDAFIDRAVRLIRFRAEPPGS